MWLVKTHCLEVLSSEWNWTMEVISMSWTILILLISSSITHGLKVTRLLFHGKIECICWEIWQDRRQRDAEWLNRSLIWKFWMQLVPFLWRQSNMSLILTAMELMRWWPMKRLFTMKMVVTMKQLFRHHWLRARRKSSRISTTIVDTRARRSFWERFGSVVPDRRFFTMYDENSSVQHVQPKGILQNPGFQQRCRGLFVSTKHLVWTFLRSSSQTIPKLFSATWCVGARCTNCVFLSWTNCWNCGKVRCREVDPVFWSSIGNHCWSGKRVCRHSVQGIHECEQHSSSHNWCEGTFPAVGDGM